MNNMSIFHCNIRSSLHNLSHLKNYLATLNLEFSIIGISENWGPIQNIDVQNIPGYSHKYCIRTNGKSGGGVNLYLKKSISYKVTTKLAFQTNDFESLVIEFDKNIFFSKKNIIVCIFYRSSNSSLKLFNEKLDNILDIIHREKKYCYIMGDFNVNCINDFSGVTLYSQQFINMFLSQYHLKLITIPTRVTQSSATLLDNIYTTDPMSGQNGVLMSDFSDHFSIFTLIPVVYVFNGDRRFHDESAPSISLCGLASTRGTGSATGTMLISTPWTFTIRQNMEPKIPDKYRYKREFTNKNISKLNKQFKKIDWNSTLNTDSVLLDFSCFFALVKVIFDSCFPQKKIKITYSNKNPWITNLLKDEIKQREKLFIKSKRNPSQINIQIYKEFKNKNLTNQRIAERNYFQKQFDLHDRNMGKTFKVIRTLLDKDAGNNVSKSIDFVVNNTMTCDPKQISNSFNNYFISVGSTLASNINSNVNPLLYVDSNVNSIIMPEVSEEEITSVILSINNSAPGYDDMPASVMKKCVYDYITPLTYLINSSIKQGIFPSELKIAKVFPIFKAGDEQLITNYRPISVLNFFSKIFEKVVANYIVDFLESNNILYEHQYGFRKGHSTNHAVITLVERVAKALDTGKIVVGVYLDIRKAFDAIDHPILLRKLYSLGIRGNLYTWIKGYLTNRSQFVMYNNSKSKTKFITHGVPQGSILGPLFFIVFMNDFSRAPNILFSILFADDTTIIIEGQNYNNLILTLNTELNKLDVWLQANKLTLNTDKTHYMVFHRARIKSKTGKISIRNNAIDEVKSTEVLGVIIDDKLKWTEHIQYIKNKISKSIGILIKIRPYLDKVTLRNLYFTFVYPYLIYCVEVWGNACGTHLDPIIKIKKKCVRVITFSHYLEPTESLFKDLKILAFKKFVIQRILLLMFKHNIGIVPKPIASLFTKKVKFIIIILDIVARFIQQLVNLKQHIELLVIMQF